MQKYLFLALILPACAYAGASETMSRMLSTVNAGVAMAAQGGNLVLQSSGGDEAVDAAATERGRALIAEGKALVVEAAGGETMMKLHSGELNDGESKEMMRLHRIEGAALKYIEALESL